ncbi:predicted thiol oxidoreductase [Reinekea sp. MED297]|uniref:Predicted thiol oxidoreductase n=2 Tax=Reinekea TaxID=230494 RepID=A4BGJ4_9GAMM|nr:predicted thiol oxidoreductase [Reinekea sp. MED297] [Reinekea blandensis MED297]
MMLATLIVSACGVESQETTATKNLLNADFGVTQTTTDTLTFYVSSTDWADVHYRINGSGQENHRMQQVNGRNEHVLDGLTAGDVIDYAFTYNRPNGATSTDFFQFMVSGDSDSDGVLDAHDRCPGTSAGTSVDANGCAVDMSFDVDGKTRIEAEDYHRFSDTTPNNIPGHYRQDAVDIEITTDTDGGYNVAYTQPGEWLAFDLTFRGGDYQLSTRVASAIGGGEYQWVLDGAVIGSGEVGNTGGWQSFESQSLPSIHISEGPHTLKLVMKAGEFNINWFEFEPTTDCQDPSCLDGDQDGVTDDVDQCPDTEAGAMVDATGCEIKTPEQEVSISHGRLVGGSHSAFPGFTLYMFDNDPVDVSTCYESCADTWPPVLVTDGTASGVNGLSLVDRQDGTFQAAYEGKPLYFYQHDSAPGQANGEGVGDLWWTVSVESDLGDIVPLYDVSTPLEAEITFDRGDALVTRIADRGRDRHAKENHFQAYDHFLTFYWEQRTISIEIIDYVAKGGDSIRMNVKALTKLDDLQAENRWWYTGVNTLAEYCGNGVMATNDNRNYWKEESWNCRENRPIQVGDKLEFEISQFLDERELTRGRSNYYGTTFLYIVGQGLVPWDVTDKDIFQGGKRFQRDSIPVPESARMGGDTTLHVQMTAEPDGHFQQMATNLSYDNGQAWVLGRRVHHTSMVDGSHDESAENGTFDELIGLSGPNYISDRCTTCHERNGRAVPAALGEPLEKWVFKVADDNGNPHADLGRVLQPKANGTESSEGTPSLASWTVVDGLRTPNYRFSSVTPERFSARIAPQLNGLGLLEAIPESAILALADENDANGDGISGRAAKVVDPETGDVRLGRFGYKAATSSVKHQTAAALNTDMGVMTSIMPSPDCGANQSNCGPQGAELNDDHLNNLVKYVSLLGVRPQRDYNDPEVIRGQQIFNDTGCSGCHVESFQTSPFHPLAELRDQTIRPYTDLLLHDMGPGLADNLGEGTASGSEWRTAPLWGVGLSACVTGGVEGPRGWDAFGLDGYETCVPEHGYLHDGRARTLDEAIRWHGGEGEASKNNYEALNAADKNALIQFIESL